MDLKARRELRAGKTSGALDVVWFDQAVVRAALAGRVLIIEGLEKATVTVREISGERLEQLRDDRDFGEPKDEGYTCLRRRSQKVLVANISNVIWFHQACDAWKFKDSIGNS